MAGKPDAKPNVLQFNQTAALHEIDYFDRYSAGTDVKVFFRHSEEGMDYAYQLAEAIQARGCKVAVTEELNHPACRRAAAFMVSAESVPLRLKDDIEFSLEAGIVEPGTPYGKIIPFVNLSATPRTTPPQIRIEPEKRAFQNFLRRLDLSQP